MKMKRSSIVKTHGLITEYVLIGDKGPLIILECGLGDTLKVWRPFIEKSSFHARILLYNRAGYGKSRSLNNPKDGQTVVKELYLLLQELHQTPPYILVGHSLGCAYVQIFTLLYPDEVGGLLLIDPMTVIMDELCMENGIKEWEDSKFKKIVISIFLSKGSKKELSQRKTILEQAKSTDFSLNNIPVTIVTAGRSMWTKPLQHQWLRSHELLSLRIPDCTHIIVENAGHHIHKEKPGLIIELIEKIMNLSTVNH